MNQLIAQQRVVKRKKRKNLRVKEQTISVSPEIRLDADSKGALFFMALRRVFEGLRFLTGPKVLYLLGGMIVVFSLLLILANNSGPAVAGIGGGLGTFPRDVGIDSLLDIYLSPGKSPDVGTADIVPTGKVLISYDPVTHTVKRGDTVSGIAEQFGLTMSTIISFNGIDNVRRLQAGAELKIPPVDGVMHLVKRGESLSSIATGYGVGLEPILDINNIGSEIIHEGDKLFVPNARMSYVSYHKAMGDLFIYPVRGVLSSGFGMRRDPFTNLMTMHNGYDIVARVGTPVVASNEGRVVYTGENSLYGRYVLLSHQGGFQTLYAHLGKWSVSEGQWVAQRQKIGELGNTGRSTGPHLHFSIYHNGQALDPGRYLYF